MASILAECEASMGGGGLVAEVYGTKSVYCMCRVFARSLNYIYEFILHSMAARIHMRKIKQQ